VVVKLVCRPSSLSACPPPPPECSGWVFKTGWDVKLVWVSCGPSTALYISLGAESMEMVMEAAERLPVIPVGLYV